MYMRSEPTANKEWTLEQLAIAERFREIIPQARQFKIKLSTAILGSNLIGDSLVKGKRFINLILLETYLKEHYTLEIASTDSNTGRLVLRHAKTKVSLARSDEGTRPRGRKQKNKLSNHHYWAASTRPNDFLYSVGEPQKKGGKRPRLEMQTPVTREDIICPFFQESMLVNTFGAQKPLHPVSPPVQSVSLPLVSQQMIVSQPVSPNNIPKNYSFRLFDHEIEKNQLYTQVQDEPAFPHLSEIYDLWNNRN